MIKKIVMKNVDFIKSNANISDIYELDRIRYGLEAFYSETFKFIILILISVLLNKFLAFLIITLMLFAVRIFIGGSHSKTTLRCLIKSSLVYISTYYLALFYKKNIFINIAIIGCAFIIILKYDPVNRFRKKNQEFLKKRKQKYIALFNICLWFLVSNLFLSDYLINCGTIIIIYILFDFYKEVKLNEKIQQS